MNGAPKNARNSLDPHYQTATIEVPVLLDLGLGGVPGSGGPGTFEDKKIPLNANITPIKPLLSLLKIPLARGLIARSKGN